MLIDEIAAALRTSLAAHTEWLALAEQFAKGGALHPWACAVLMTLPVAALARAWWWEAAD